METSFRIKLSELDSDILKTIRQLFKKDREITLTISSATDFDLNKTESKQNAMIDITGNSKGIYFVTITNKNKQVETLKIILN